YSNNVTIGGNTAATRNIVSSNGKQGIVLSADPNTEMTGTLIIGNYCGTDVTGSLARGNGQSGIISIFASNSTIGRANANEGNILSNNSEEGLHLIGGTNNTVYNNLIGVAANGTTAMGNKSGGIFIQGVGSAPDGNSNTIGGLGALQANTIAYTTNTGANPSLGNGFGIGVAVSSNTMGIKNTFIGNKIFCNAGLGIDLDFAAAFGGSGNSNPGNNSKSAPAITAVTSTSTSGTGTNGETIHVYSNVTCTTCQGEVYLGTAVVAGGVWTVTHASVAIPSNNSATATNATQGTSQFTCNFPLPVELIYFKAKAQGNMALLTWSTAMEINNASFVIERSADGKHFEPIGNKTGQGNTLQVSNYDFTDLNPLGGTSYYRLTQIDFNGTQTHTSIQAVSFQTATDFFLFPNPAKDELNIVLNNDEHYEVRIYTNLGVEIPNLTTIQHEDTYTIRLNGVASGSYIIELNSATHQFTKQFLVY
ncbi:MAG TPA: T9SS type A sorting domain-containing protein, partial [Cytophagaceae bacterium]|nr:T9SS type A sorting domain-containing protein [Cytophagaceae bacterium]